MIVIQRSAPARFDVWDGSVFMGRVFQGVHAPKWQHSGDPAERTFDTREEAAEALVKHVNDRSAARMAKMQKEGWF